jgi:DGQHR domain-containing protein
MSQLVEHHGESIDLGLCILGSNLNITAIRGYSDLATLADISSGDVYDEILNPEGTQRDLKAKHSKEALEYALGALEVSPEESPRAFPEITLNARDANVIEIEYPQGGSFDLDTYYASGESLPQVVRVKIRASAIKWPKPKFDPQISRVDGNHRLSQAEDLFLAGEDARETPSVPFSLFIGLSTQQERKIFSDINGKHVGMPAAILTSFESAMLAPEIALVSANSRAAWIARQLTQPGRAFHGKVHFGGATEGTRELFGNKPSLTIQGLKSAVAKSLEKSPRLVAQLFPVVDLADPLQNTDFRKEERIKSGAKVVILLDRFWSAVRDSNPEAWENKRDYILLSSIGLMGFSELAGPLIEDLVISKKTARIEDFKAVTDHLAEKVSLSKDNYRAIAGAGGAKKVATDLLEAWMNSDVSAVIAVSGLSDESTDLNY